MLIPGLLTEWCSLCGNDRYYWPALKGPGISQRAAAARSQVTWRWLVQKGIMKRIRHNDLTHYFLRDHKQLPAAYLRSCEKFFKSLKLQATSRKQQAASFKLDKDK